MASRVLLALALLSCLHSLALGIKLKFRYEECMQYEMVMYEPFYGSFVALPDLYSLQAKYDLIVTSPSGTRVHEVQGESEAKFHLVPYETGKYRFCLRLNQEKTGSRYVLSREVLWDLHVGHAETHGAASLKEHDTQGLWHYVHQVDAQLQQLRATQQYLYWRERRHRLTVESTNRRVLVYALLRSGVLVAVSIAQTLFLRHLFVRAP
ncbi:hypothetical protein HYH03_013691 [Edaphochlamys debaryana]|uniref:GOLD domain-containing protein n=1 Tax=Edaphochlamys debaryana TaxID=47281 RepID=A0A836BT26_9CHLO|nr:hypothetical protein HYH03_013691 [Edaphochlamys debaryana]|eukprot:KAG2487692.1 hypothetical protein HYH03_013691 [Edaphochlamys debaryana]